MRQRSVTCAKERFHHHDATELSNMARCSPTRRSIDFPPRRPLAAAKRRPLNRVAIAAHPPTIVPVFRKSLRLQIGPFTLPPPESVIWFDGLSPISGLTTAAASARDAFSRHRARG